MSEKSEERHGDRKEGGNEEEEEEPVTMLDVLHDEESLEQDAKAVLGSADDKNCTYKADSYAKRQALYSCLNCVKTGEKAGICLACSYHCHEGHELVELYTKRDFRCDCGNSKMDNECKLTSDREATNEKNKYYIFMVSMFLVGKIMHFLTFSGTTKTLMASIALVSVPIRIQKTLSPMR